MDERETYRATLQYAVEIAGSEPALAARLNVPLGLLKNWLDGIAEAPTSAFLDAVDVIVSATPAEIARCRESLRTRRPLGET
jgi:hypothetical protein